MRTLVLCCFSLCFFQVSLSPVQADLPEGWDQLAASDFAEQVYGLKNDNDLSFEEISEVEPHAADLLTNMIESSNDFETLFKLQRICRKHLKLNPDLREQLKAAVIARQDDWTGKHFDEVGKKLRLMGYMGIDIGDVANEAKKWKTSGGDMSQVWDEYLPYIHLLYEEPQIVRTGFSVKWQGKVTATSTGNYTFSISPHNVNAIHNMSSSGYYLQESMKVTVGGQQIVSAAPEQWNPVGSTVSMTAGQPVDIVVEMEVDSPKLPRFAVHALLFWEGPGVAKQIVPKSQLTTPNGSQNGLEAIYSWKNEAGETESLTRIDDSVDFTWNKGELALSTDTTYQKQGMNILWTKTMTSAALGTFENSLPSTANSYHRIDEHLLLGVPEGSADGLTMTQRKDFLTELVSHPKILKSMNARQIGDICMAFRYGMGDLTGEVFGAWAIQNKDHSSELKADFKVRRVDGISRTVFLNLATCFTQELSWDEIQKIKTDYLEMENGSCCLPVAYVLGYCYLSQNRFQEWIDFLISKLEDDSLTGDQRVNWLLARAHAQEIRLGPAKPFTIPWERPLDGRVWIEEASLIANSGPVKARVAKEMAARLLAIYQFDQAKSTLENVSSSSPTQITGWLIAVNHYKSAHEKDQADKAQAAKAAYIGNLKKRQEKAIDRGDQEAADRYDALIQTAEAE